MNADSFEEDLIEPFFHKLAINITVRGSSHTCRLNYAHSLVGSIFQTEDIKKPSHVTAFYYVVVIINIAHCGSADV